MINATGESIQNITTEIPGVLNNVDAYFSFITVQNVYLKAALVFGIFLAFAFFMRFVFGKILHTLVKGTETEIDDKIIATARGPMLLLVIVFGLMVSGRILNVHEGIDFYDKIFLSIIILLILWVLLKIVVIIAHGLKETLGKRSVKLFDSKIFPFFEKILGIVFAVIYLFFLFDIWKIDVTPLLASAGIAGIAIAFAAQESIANVFGGVSMFADKTYEIGDYIVVDDKDRGQVVDIGMRSTKIRTTDNVIIVMPNSVLAKAKVINETGDQPNMRIRVPIDVSYIADLDKVEKVLLNIADTLEIALKDPKPLVRFRAFKTYSIGVELMFWIKSPEFKGQAVHFAIKEIYRQFKKNNIEFPYPLQEIYLKSKQKK